MEMILLLSSAFACHGTDVHHRLDFS